MPTVHANYQITLSDYRKAVYYGMFLRHRKPLRLLFIVIILGIIYLTGGLLGLGEINPLVLLVAAAYLVWGLVLFAGAEKDIRKYMKSPSSLIGCDMEMTLDPKQIRLTIPAHGVNEHFPPSKLACAFELDALFLLYFNTQEVYLLPTRALSQEERISVRKMLREVLGDRFGSRYDTAKKR